MQFFRQQNKVLNTVIFVVEIDMVYIIFRRDGYTIMFCVQLAIIHNQKNPGILGHYTPKYRECYRGGTPVISPYIGSGQCLFRCKYKVFYLFGNNKFKDCFGSNAALISSTLLSLATNDTTG